VAFRAYDVDGRISRPTKGASKMAVKGKRAGKQAAKQAAIDAMILHALKMHRVTLRHLRDASRSKLKAHYIAELKTVRDAIAQEGSR
jgi:hypothetical protein